MRDEYLERLGIGPDRRGPSLEYLAELQAAHLINVPFENLDVFRLYASEWGARFLIRGGDGRSGQVIPPVCSSTRSR